MKNVKNKKMMAVVLPEGCFYGNCSDCVYADRSDWRDGEVYCLCEKGWTHGYKVHGTVRVRMTWRSRFMMTEPA